MLNYQDYNYNYDYYDYDYDFDDHDVLVFHLVCDLMSFLLHDHDVRIDPNKNSSNN